MSLYIFGGITKDFETAERCKQSMRELCNRLDIGISFNSLDEDDRKEIENRERRALSMNGNKPMPAIYYQLLPTSTSLRIIPPTRTGIDPFDDDSKGEYRCPLGHVIGLNLLSEIYIDRSSYDGSDITFTLEMIGLRRGLLRPSRLILISPRLRSLLIEKGVKGFKTDIAHLS